MEEVANEEQVGPFESSLRTLGLAGVITVDPPIHDGVARGEMPEWIRIQRIEARADDGVESCLAQAYRALVEIRTAEDPNIRIRAYHRVVAYAERALELCITEAHRHFTACEVKDAILWGLLHEAEVAGPQFRIATVGRVIAAERILVEHLGAKAYRSALESRRRRSAACGRTVLRVWRGRVSSGDAPVFCTHCHRMVGKNLEDAQARAGAEVGPLGPWGICPECDQPTVLRN